MHHGAPDGVWAVGDIHGARDRLVELLRAANLLDNRERWSAGAAVGVAVGDYVNRGPDGARVLALLREMQSQAHARGGEMIALLGNHDALLCGVLAERRRMPYGEVASRWLLNEGRFLDLEALERDTALATWLAALPVMARVGHTLYVHSDALVYLDWGTSVEEVNATVRAILASNNLDRIAALFDQLCRRGELRDPANVDRMLSTFGANRIVFGHTPVFDSHPHLSPDRRCVAIDGGLWVQDSPEPLGFIYWDEP